MSGAAVRRRVGWRTIMSLGLGVLVVTLLGVIGGATCRPSWYEPTAIDHTRLKADKRDFVHLLDSIGAALNSGRTIEFELGEEQLNRWVAARAEFWPGWERAIGGVSYPQVNLLGGNRVRLAATVGAGPIEVVLSVVGRWELAGEELLIHMESVRSGALPIPRGRVLGAVGRVLAERPVESVTVSGGTVRLGNEWIWENGKCPFRLGGIDVSAGAVRVLLEPVGRRR